MKKNLCNKFILNINLFFYSVLVANQPQRWIFCIANKIKTKIKFQVNFLGFFDVISDNF
jgi:hypothetical protein